MTIYTSNKWNECIMSCKRIATEFILWRNTHKTPINLIEDCECIDMWALTDEEQKKLFNGLCAAVHVRCYLANNRDSDREAAHFTHETNTVVVPYSFGYRDSKSIVQIFLHEIFHSIQYRAIADPSRFPVFSSNMIEKWKEEAADYENGDKDPIKYANQEMEKTANAFAWEIINDIPD